MRISKCWNKKKTFFVALLCALAVCIGWFIMPTPVNSTIPGVLWRDDSEFYQFVTVELQGQRSGFQFWGDIAVPEMGLRIENASLNLGNGYAKLYGSNINNDARALGAVVSTDCLRTLLLLFREDCVSGTADGTDYVTSHMGGQNRLMLSAPCATREEAVDIGNRLCKKSVGYRQHYLLSHFR